MYSQISQVCEEEPQVKSFEGFFSLANFVHYWVFFMLKFGIS